MSSLKQTEAFNTKMIGIQKVLTKLCKRVQICSCFSMNTNNMKDCPIG